MEELNAIISDLRRIHGVDVPAHSLTGAIIYTTPEYRIGFQRKWGYPVRATGVMLPAERWQNLQELLGIPKHLAAQEYLPWRCTSCPHGFVLIKEQKYKGWNFDHEMLHFAHYEHSAGFRSAIESFQREARPEYAQQRIEAEMLYELCAFRDNVGMGIEGKDWSWAQQYLIDNYLPEELSQRAASTGSDLSHLRAPLAAGIRDIIARIRETTLSPSEITGRFFGIAYNEPFAEFIAALARKQ